MTIDAMFVSPRSGKPLKWVYGRNPPFLKQNGMICVAYETECMGGKRLVFGARGMFAELDDSQFRSLFPKG
jgi:hypothetical protein